MADRDLDLLRCYSRIAISIPLASKSEHDRHSTLHEKKPQQKFWTMISGYQQIYSHSDIKICHFKFQYRVEIKRNTHYITFWSLGVLSSLYLSRDIQQYKGEFMSSHYFPVSV